MFHPGRWQSSYPKARLAQSAKIAFFIRIFADSIKLWSNRQRFYSFLVSLDGFQLLRFENSTKKNDQKLKKKLGVPLAFFQILAQKFSFEYSAHND